MGKRRIILVTTNGDEIEFPTRDQIENECEATVIFGGETMVLDREDVEEIRDQFTEMLDAL